MSHYFSSLRQLKINISPLKILKLPSDEPVEKCGDALPGQKLNTPLGGE